MPILILTGNDDEDLAMQAVREGAQDYLLKELANERSLARAIRYAIERHRLLHELEQNRQEQLAIKDQFLSHVSHELRSPLASIYDFVSIVLDGLAGELTPEQKDYLGVVLKNVNQLRSILSDLSQAFRAQAGKLAVEVACGSTVELILDTVETLASIAERKSVQLDVRLEGYIPAFLGDRRRLQEVLVNLIDNAVKYTPEGGSITIEAGPSPEDADQVVVAVHDTGCGIQPEIIDRVFERLFQEHPGDHRARTGLGLGLYICRELLARQSGRIWATSRVGHGSSFCFAVPAYPLVQLLAPEGVEAWSDPVLIMTTVRLAGQPAAARRASSLFGKAYREFQACVRPGSGVVLPRMLMSEGSEAFALVTRPDPAEAASIAERIQSQLTCSSRSQGPGVVVDSTTASLSAVALSGPASFRALAQALATSLEERRRTTASSEGAGVR